MITRPFHHSAMERADQPNHEYAFTIISNVQEFVSIITLYLQSFIFLFRNQGMSLHFTPKIILYTKAQFRAQYLHALP